MPNFKLFIVFHKSHILPSVPYTIPIQAGTINTLDRLSKYNDIDNDNIGDLNKYFAELTAIYSIVKNKLYTNTDYWGLTHYRRYFCNELHWSKIKKKEKYELPATVHSLQKIFTPSLQNNIEKNLSPNTIILPKPQRFKKTKKENFTVKEFYANHHISADWQLLSDVIKNNFIDYFQSFSAVENKTEMLICNMMIAHKNVWGLYSNWVFAVLFEMMKHKKTYEENYQQRVYGFLAERLLQVYLHHHAAQYNFVYMPMAILK